MSVTRAISTTSRRELLSRFFSVQGKAPKEIHAILTERVACFLPGRAKDLSALLCMVNVPLHSIQIMHTFIFRSTKALDSNFHIRTVHLDIIKVPFIHQLIH